MNFKPYYPLLIITSLFYSTQLIAESQTTNISNLIAPIKQPIIAYFDKNGVFNKYAVKNGYYRVLLERNTDGLYLVQDFYQSNNKPQSSPFWEAIPAKLFSFESSDVDGSITLYREDGTIISKFVNKDGDVIDEQEYYPNGQIGSSYKLTEDGFTTIEFWYASGAKATKYILDADEKLVSSKAWKEDGTETEDFKGVSEKVYALLDHDFQKD